MKRISFLMLPIIVSIVIGLIQFFIVYEYLNLYMMLIMLLLGVFRLLCLFFTLGNAKVGDEKI